MFRFTWAVGEDDARFPAAVGADGIRPDDIRPDGAYPHRRPFTNALLALMAACLVFLAWQRAEAGHGQVQRDVEAAVHQELAARADGQREALAAVLDPRASATWLEAQYRRPGGEATGDLEVISVQVLGNQALAQVLAPSPTGAGPRLRESRFYRLTAEGWRRSEPSPAFWGPRRELSTAYFRFHYQQLDAGTVESLAAEIDALYETTRQRYGLARLNPNRSYVVEVMPQPTPTQYLAGQGWLRLASPYWTNAAHTLSHGEVLAQQIGAWIAAQMIYERAHPTRMAAPALRLLLYCLGQHAAWDWAPADPHWDMTRRQYLRQAVAEGRWTAADSGSFYPLHTRSFQERAYQCSTVGEFISERYGAGRFGDLVAATAQRYRWNDVVEAGLGVPHPHFMRDWQAFIRQRYGGD